MNGPKFRVLFHVPHQPQLMTLALDFVPALWVRRVLKHFRPIIVIDERSLRVGDRSSFSIRLPVGTTHCGADVLWSAQVCYAPSPQAVLTPAEIEVLVPQKVTFAGLEVQPIGPVTIEVPRREPRTEQEFAEWMESQLARLVRRGRPRRRKQ